MQKVLLRAPASKSGPAELVMPNGDIIPGVISVGVPTIRANTLPRVVVELLVDVNLLGSPIFSKEALTQIAKHHGYKLVKADAVKA